ncbi:MAG: hypothetical protein Q8R92_16985 [Deltaproteobacteria bacterium]|nr:hypothetical protein [Deltaproteobacteria bacterium]
MKTCSKCKVTKPKAEFSKRLDGLQPKCKACANAWRAAHYLEHRETILASAAAYYIENKVEIDAAHSAYRAAHAEEKAAYNTAYYFTNRERIRTQQALYGAGYCSENPEKYAAQSAKRRAAKLQANPAWADPDAITLIYADCAFMNGVTDVRHEVDHIVPLISKHVSGLNVEFNLRVTPEKTNRSKGNRHWPGQEWIMRSPG